MSAPEHRTRMRTVGALSSSSFAPTRTLSTIRTIIGVVRLSWEMGTILLVELLVPVIKMASRT
eukprot:scaffold211455_cov35-Prasinocladus_malaysianus.AAC.1